MPGRIREATPRVAGRSPTPRSRSFQGMGPTMKFAAGPLAPEEGPCLMKLLRIIAAGVLLALAGCAHGPDPALIRQAEAGKRLAEAYMDEGKMRSALRELEKAQLQNPKDAEIYYDIGTVYLALQQPQMAVTALKKALVLRPDYAVAKNTLGTAYITMKQWDKAIPLFQELSDNLIYATPQYPLLNLGYIYYCTGDYAKSAAEYQKSIEYSKDFAQAWRGLGRTYLAMGRSEEAVTALNKAVSLAPRFEWAWLDLGDALQKAGRVKEALLAWKKVREIAPNSEAGRLADTKLTRFGNWSGG